MLPARRFELRRLLGEGGMGTVHVAFDRLLGVEVALKRVRPGVDDARTRARFRQEQRLAAGLAHPALVPVLEIGELDGALFLTMPLADGSLRAFDGGWGELVPRIDQLLAALSHLHAKQILHRDIKPANVLLHPGGVWLADLGLAGLRSSFEARRLAGSPGYMAPEQRRGQVEAFGPATDLFAVGVLLDELGHAAGAPAGLEQLVDDLLRESPLSRPQLAADVRARLRGLGDPSTHRRTTFGRAKGATTVDLGELSTWSEPLGDDRPSAPPAPGPLPDAFPAAQVTAPPAASSVELFAHRPLPLVGRDAAVQTIWEVARSCQEDGEARAVAVVGAEGSGRADVCDAVVEALEAGGWAETIRGADILGGALRACARGLVTVVVQAADLSDAVQLFRLEGIPALVLARLDRSLGHPDVVEVHCDPLDAAHVGRVLEASLSLAPDLAEGLAAHAGGSLAFARQVVLHWAACGLLRDMGGHRFGLDPTRGDPPMPADIESWLAEQLERLGDPVELAALAVVGRSVPGRLVARLAGDGVADAVLGPGAERTWRHEAWRRVAARRATPQVHRAVGDAWASVGRLGRAGVHVLESGDVDEAARLLERHTDGLEPHAVIESATCEALIAAAERCIELRPRACLWRIRRHRFDGELVEAMALLDGLPVLDAELLWLRGQLLMDLSRLDEAVASFEEALEGIDERHRSLVLMLCARAAFQAGQTEQGTARLREAEQAAGTPHDRGWCALTRAQAQVARGESARDRLDEAERAFQEAADLRGLAVTARTRGIAALHAGDDVEGRAALETSLRLMLRAGLTNAAIGVRIALAEADRRAGREDRSRAMLLAARFRALQLGQALDVAAAGLGLARLDLSTGELDAARAALAEVESAIPTGDRPRWIVDELGRLRGLVEA